VRINTLAPVMASIAMLALAPLATAQEQRPEYGPAINIAAAKKIGAGVTASPGGVPIFVDGKVIGAVGVSGVTGDQDEQCAKAGIAGM